MKEIQDAYRDTVLGKDNVGKIDSAAAAYNVIQNYYIICLPQTIEGTLLETVTNATPASSNPGESPDKTKKPKSKNAADNLNATSLNAKMKLKTN